MKTLYMALLMVLCFATAAFSSESSRELKARYDSCRTCITSGRNSRLENIRCAYSEIEIGKKLKNDRMMMQGNIDLGRGLSSIKKYDFALQYVHKALELSRKVKSDEMLADVNRLAGAIYANLGNEAYAKKYIDKAYQYYEEQKDTINIIRTMSSMGILHGEKKEFDKSIELFKDAYWLSYKCKAENFMFIIMLNQLRAYNLTGDTDNGMLTVHRIEAEFDSITLTKDPNKYAFFLLNRGGLHLQNEELELAKKDLQTALALGTDAVDPNTRILLLKELAVVSQKMCDFELLSECYTKIMHLQDSLENIEMRKNIAEMEFMYSITQKDKKLEELEQRMIKNRLIFILLTLIALIIASLIYWRIKIKSQADRKNMEELNDKLQQKRKELTDIAIYHHEVRSIVNEAVEDLQKIETHVTTDREKKAIRKLHLQLNESFSDNSKAQIYNFIDDNYSDFIERLSQKYPDLLVSEKRICAMLLIDFSTKEIANVLNLSERSINNIRSKIRKKLGISESISISAFLKSI